MIYIRITTIRIAKSEVYLGNAGVYLEPSKVTGTRGYFAIARIHQIIHDPKTPEMYLALIERGSFLEFASHVAFNEDNEPIERGLLNNRGKLSGRAQSAVRPISPQDFNRIIERGLVDKEPTLPRLAIPEPTTGFADQQEPFSFDSVREKVKQFTTRIVRDRVFRKIVIQAYDERCAFTGLKLINGGGRAEVNAAHIQPVERNGPDIVNNGIALSGTAHWMFDRGLISLSNDLEILVSRQVNDIEGVRAFINRCGRATLPQRNSNRPHPHFLDWHRENCFKH
jgi:putative restriction endonuclease